MSSSSSLPALRGAVSPLRLLAAALVVGTMGGLSVPVAAVPAAVTALLAAVVARRRGRGTRAHALWLVVAAAALAGALRGAVAEPPPAPPGFRETPVVLHGTVETAPRIRRDAAGGREALLRMRLSDEDRAALLRVRLAPSEAPPALLPGDGLRVAGRASAPRVPTNPGERDRRDALRREGVVLHVAVPSSGALHREAPVRPTLLQGLRREGARARRDLLRRLHAALPGRPRAAAVLAALLVGDRAGLPDDLADDFRHAGAAHLLAVSGLHVVLLVSSVAGLLEILRRRLWPGRRGRLATVVLVLLFVVAYAVVCGLATPVVRASLFVTVAVVGRHAGRRTGTLDHLAVAAAVVSAADPAQALSPGFLLSFSAVLGLCLLTQRFREALFAEWDLLARFPEALPGWRLRVHAWLAAGLSASLAAATGTAAVTAVFFGELHPAAPLSNLVAVPLVAVLLPAAALAALAGAPAAPVAGPLLDALTGALTTLLSRIGSLPGATLVPGPASPWVAAGVGAALVAVASSAPWRRRHLLVPAVCWMVLAVPQRAPPEGAAPSGPDLVALDVGHGVAVLLRGGAGGAVLYDAGGRLPGTAERVVAPALRALGATRLAAIAISHEDADHCGAVPELLAELTVGAVLVPAGFGGSAAGRRVLRASARHAVPVVHLGRGDRWELRDVRLRALHPFRNAVGPAENEGSLVLHATLGSGGSVLTALLPGDAEGRTLDALAADRTLPPAEVLLLPHHGRGPPEPQLRLSARCGARHRVASTPDTSPTEVPGALVTGRDGALLLAPRQAPKRLRP